MYMQLFVYLWQYVFNFTLEMLHGHSISKSEKLDILSCSVLSRAHYECKGVLNGSNVIRHTKYQILLPNISRLNTNSVPYVKIHNEEWNSSLTSYNVRKWCLRTVWKLGWDWDGHKRYKQNRENPNRTVTLD